MEDRYLSVDKRMNVCMRWDIYNENCTDKRTDKPSQ